jgi:hypothetical protein
MEAPRPSSDSASGIQLPAVRCARRRVLRPWLSCLIAAAGTACGVAAGAPRTTPETRSPAPWFTTFADSFLDVRLRPPRADTGWLSEHFEALANGYRLTEAFGIGPLTLRTATVFFDLDLAVDSVRGTVRGARFADFAVTYVRRRVTGWYAAGDTEDTPRFGIEGVRPESAFDVHALKALLPRLPWAVGLKRTLFEFDPTNASTQTWMLTVLDEERVTVPAGTFDAFRAELADPAELEYVWYTRDMPHRCVKVVNVTNDWSTELLHY